ncbi:MAG: ABC transporter substrate-binding protein [Proteobacteria bacterium]|nr:ABC transporter substrate-binding protein [Pseudomonadota bacterium]
MLRNKILPVLFLIACFSVPAMAPTDARAENTKEQGAINLIKSIGNQAVQTLSNKSLSEKQKEQDFDKFLDTDFDMPLIARFVLGRYWRSATDAERQEFQSVFRNYMVASYSQRIGSYSGENIKINNATSLNDKESLVYTVIERPQGPPIKLDWRVRKNGSGQQKVIDVIVEGVSMAQTQRSEFATVAGKPGVGVPGLIKELQAKTKAEGGS